MFIVATRLTAFWNLERPERVESDGSKKLKRTSRQAAPTAFS
jgi:hypothetical protein